MNQAKIRDVEICFSLRKGNNSWFDDIEMLCVSFLDFM